jgi:hypothetical protein
LVKKAVLVVNIEHVAARNFSWARTTAADGYREAIADLGEVTLYAGVANKAPLLDNLIVQGGQRYGTNLLSARSDLETGEMGGFIRPAAHAARVTFIQSFPGYHTTGDVLEMTSTPGLERVARTLAFLIKGVDKAPRSNIVGASEKTQFE